MALTLGDNFSYQGKKPLDKRLSYNSVAEMKAVDDSTIYEGCTAYCIATGKDYQWKSTNAVDQTYGRWRPYVSTVDSEIDSVSENPVQNKAIKQALDGKADLIGGKIPASQLPGDFADKIIEAYYKAEDDRFYESSTFEVETLIAPAAGKSWVDKTTNKSYRWTGTAYVRVDEEVQLGETADTAYRGDRGKIAYDDSQANKAAIGNLANLQTDVKTDLVSVINEVNAKESIPTGGTTGQILTKQSNGKSGWADPSGGTITKAITAAVEVGGINEGTVISAGTDIEEILSNILEPTLYPTFVAPSATISATGAKLLETGATASVTFTITFNRGSITPAYTTSGYRAGAAESYALNGGETQSANTFTETVSSINKTFTGTVNYAAGEQPKDSKENNYQTPLAAGSVNTNTINYEFVDALWSNTSNITTVAKLALVSKGAKVKEFNFPAQTVANPEVFDIPSAWTVTAVEVLNTLSNQWEDCSSEFTISSTTHNNAADASVNYTRYTDNRGYAAAARKVRVKWS